MRRGFPGPAAHWEAYQYLKDRTLRSLLKELKASSSHAKNPHAKLLLMSGIRKDESNRRAVIQTKEHHMEGQRIWLAPIIDYSATDCTFYIRDHNLKRSPVKDRIHMSGECFCGAFARPSEYHELKQWYPYQVERIHKWQALVEMSRELREWEIERGLAPKNEAIKHCQWGWKDSLPQNQMSMPMCWSCSQATSSHTTRLQQ
jgi:3'-phosphoadenosine 5'-phosphosulfate sulfotransferase (PAPS reductase)/FAD synthetase